MISFVVDQQFRLPPSLSRKYIILLVPLWMTLSSLFLLSLSLSPTRRDLTSIFVLVFSSFPVSSCKEELELSWITQVCIQVSTRVAKEVSLKPLPSYCNPLPIDSIRCLFASSSPTTFRHHSSLPPFSTSSFYFEKCPPHRRQTYHPLRRRSSGGYRPSKFGRSRHPRSSTLASSSLRGLRWHVRGFLGR